MLKMWTFISAVDMSKGAVGLIKHQLVEEVCRCKRRLDGKTVIITGANSGIGKVASFALAEKGATVILACRNEVEGLRVAEEIRNLTENPSIKFEYLDLTSFDSIRSFVERLASDNTDVYALVNNAGIFYHPFKVTEDNFEITYQTNYLGPFYLTVLLLNRNVLKKGCRIVNVVSEAHHIPQTLDVNKVSIPDPNLGEFVRYGESKLCLVLFTEKLGKIFPGVTVFSVDPGNVETNIYRHFPLLNNPCASANPSPIRYIFVKSPEQGAQTVIHGVLITSRASITGNYFRDCKFSTEASGLARSEKLADDLWANSLKCCKVTLNEDVENVCNTAE